MNRFMLQFYYLKLDFSPCSSFIGGYCSILLENEALYHFEDFFKMKNLQVDSMPSIGSLDNLKEIGRKLQNSQITFAYNRSSC